jgi:predicted RNase H-like HicB family nuclease
MSDPQITETTVELNVETLPEGLYLVTSPDVPGLVAEGRSLSEAVEIAQGLIRKIAESCLENGDPLPSSLQPLADSGGHLKLRVPVSLP